VSAYRTAIDRTARVIERRARFYRNLVVAVVLIGVASLAVALLARSLAGLAGVLFLVPACGFFVHADARLLNDWRSGVLARWARGELDLAALRPALHAHPGLPRDTLDGMLGTLPSTADLAEEQRILAPSRQAAAAANRAMHQVRSDLLLLDATVSGIAAAGLVGALWLATWMPLLGLIVLVLRLPLGAWTRRRRLAARDADVAACRRQPGFSEPDYARLLSAPQSSEA
jgi:hypothetical protein